MSLSVDDPDQQRIAGLSPLADEMLAKWLWHGTAPGTSRQKFERQHGRGAVGQADANRLTVLTLLTLEKARPEPVEHVFGVDDRVVGGLLLGERKPQQAARDHPGEIPVVAVS